jgi:hypothetical protein
MALTDHRHLHADTAVIRKPVCFDTLCRPLNISAIDGIWKKKPVNLKADREHGRSAVPFRDVT